MAVALALGLCGALASSASAEGGGLQVPGALHVYLNDASGFFSDKGIAEAKVALEKTLFSGGLVMTVDVLARPPQGREVPADEKQRGKFFLELARELATADRARGIYILVCRSPGYVQVIADKATRERGFSNDDERKVRDILVEGLRAASKLEKESPQQAVEQRDKALLAAVQFVVEDLRNTAPPMSGNNQNRAAAPKAADLRVDNGNAIAGWICIGLVALLALWLIVGFIRALSGMGTASAGGAPAGGGGFFSSLLGGLFGAMAGMWLYNHLFGGGSFWSGGETGGGMAGGEADSTGGIAGEGDFSGDTGAGGSFDSGGDTGGGDWGGGDWGGGDWGGGDFGGGGD
jgi:uncharacterized protein